MPTRTTQSPPRLVNRWPWISGPIVFGLLLASMFFAILALARANVLTFPLPNEDDASFFFPAWNLAVHGTLRVPLLNAPDGIFWVPHGFYLWLSLFLRALAPTLEVAHGVPADHRGSRRAAGRGVCPYLWIARLMPCTAACCWFRRA